MISPGRVCRLKDLTPIVHSPKHNAPHSSRIPIMNALFSTAAIGPYSFKHRVVMAPLTRMRSSDGNIPNDLIAAYYAQRTTDGGLIVSEATPVSARGYGYARAPGIYT